MVQSIMGQGGQQSGGQQSGGQTGGSQTGYGPQGTGFSGGQGGGFGPQQGIELHLKLDDVDELECLLKSLSDTQQQLTQSEVPTWMKNKYLPRIQAMRNAITQQVNQQFRPGAQHPAAQQIAQALETV